ncbi:hypothetical protein G6F46_006860 [Rhizopus delemar]|uniref:Uncharacterized protein n=2 Tax=Rhizopus TaxID=4842 RepID=A0A9P6Z3D9_9FUNG|nr:hypothetical protein G6F55_008126 [Rhizopus delemar]KAG1542891.1 hypothetical protein G6F51_007002 [Rhizopus arrhizus]KAG1500929.1 hypothetical protein G6F54_003385 [Rhizopus delemar]KAG1510877.1 hypothetical protein G6F53_006353 [Rhizopus delemar]KAG1522549.1 hypothetical protein G6F52_005767 [Rhizopus delemar]
MSLKRISDCGEEEEATFDFLEAVLKAIHVCYLAKQDLCDGENTFNSLLLYPFLNVVCFFVAETVAESNIEFKVGEAFLKSMSKQLKKSSAINDSCQYKADGLKIYLDKEIEVALLGTSSHFRSNDKAKRSFDHHKGAYGALAMMKNIADDYCFANAETFSKLKVLFVHAADDKVFLWSINFIKECSMFEMWEEKALEINPSPSAKSVFIPECISFYLYMKEELSKTARCVLQLKKEHEEALKEFRPSILKMTEEEDKAGMA